jgi:PPK2 family polyphosphate:nucleotide phosphotransferase
VNEPVQSPWLVPFDGGFRLAGLPTVPPAGERDKSDNQKRLQKAVRRLANRQELFWAADRYSLLLVFQALDAAGKDGTIRAVMSGVNPAGCQVFSFKAPSAEDLDHDFLWRTARCLPERGRIGIFNRSYYEEVLVVRVHPGFLDGQRLPSRPPLPELWRQRHESIRQHEEHLARNGTVVVKFFLNVSRDEQRDRFVARLREPEKTWKFNARDVEERAHWDDYHAAYEDALNATSRPWAPWYAVPADDKAYMRAEVADIVSETIERLHLEYPKVAEEDGARFARLRRRLESGEL